MKASFRIEHLSKVEHDTTSSKLKQNNKKQHKKQHVFVTFTPEVHRTDKGAI